MENSGVKWGNIPYCQNGSELVLGEFYVFWSKEFWPPSTPDLNPMDFEVWSILEHKACATSHKNIDALKHSLEKSCNKIFPETLRATCSQVIDRL